MKIEINREEFDCLMEAWGAYISFCHTREMSYGRKYDNNPSEKYWKEVCYWSHQHRGAAHFFRPLLKDLREVFKLNDEKMMKIEAAREELELLVDGLKRYADFCKRKHKSYARRYKKNPLEKFREESYYWVERYNSIGHNFLPLFKAFGVKIKALEYDG